MRLPNKTGNNVHCLGDSGLRTGRPVFPSSRGISVMLLVLCAAVVGACNQDNYLKFEERMALTWDDGAYAEAGKIGADVAKDNEDEERDRVAYHMEAGRTLQAAGDIDASIANFKRANFYIRPYLDTESETSIGGWFSDVFGNQADRTYLGTAGERIMLNTFQALNYMVKGDMQSARVELNKAGDWQQDAVARYARAIKKRAEELLKEAQENGIAGPAVSGRVPADCLADYQNLEDSQRPAESEYRNPFSTHLRGIFRLARGRDLGDWDSARFDLRAVAQMVPGAAATLADDLALADSLSGRGASDLQMTWVYFLTGRAPFRQEVISWIPVRVQRKTVRGLLALPRLEIIEDHAPILKAHTTGGVSATAVTIADMDQIVCGEFKEQLPGIIARECISASMKAHARYGRSKKQGPGDNLLGRLWQRGTLAADLRSWRTLPKLVQVCRVSTPQDGWITLTGERGQKYGRVRVKPNESNIIMVTLPSRRVGKPSIMTIQLTGEQSS